MTESRTEPRSLVSRLRGVMAFLAIAWVVAGSFVVFELFALQGSETLRGSALALSADVRNSTVCDSSLTEPAADAMAVAAWQLGVYAGAEARVAQFLTPAAQTSGDSQAQQQFADRARAVRDVAHAEVERAAATLRVPMPAAFTARDVVNVIVEYGPFLEGNGNDTARAIAAAYGRRTCEVYKLGSYWGFGSLMRNAGVEHPFAAEVNHYGDTVGIPDTLLAPMVAAPDPAKPIDTDAVTNAISAYLTQPH